MHVLIVQLYMITTLQLISLEIMVFIQQEKRLEKR